MPEPQPKLQVTVESCARAADAWLVTFGLLNTGPSLVVHSAWIPHGRFRGAAGRQPVDIPLASDSQQRLTLRVVTHEPPGSVVENSFLILQTERWRIFTRMRVEFTPDPVPIVEQVTLQPLES